MRGGGGRGGGSGLVYRVRDQMDEEYYAMKKIYFPSLATGPSQDERLSETIGKIRKLVMLNPSASFVVRYISAWIEDHEELDENDEEHSRDDVAQDDHFSPNGYILYIQMELCRGTLANYVAERNKNYLGEDRKRKLVSKVDFQVALNISLQVTNAVAYLHENLKIVHRNLKLENIWFAKDWTPKIHDINDPTPLNDEQISKNYLTDIHDLGKVILKLYSPLDESEFDLFVSSAEDDDGSIDDDGQFARLLTIILGCLNSSPHHQVVTAEQLSEMIEDYGMEHSMIKKLNQFDDFRMEMKRKITSLQNNLRELVLKGIYDKQYEELKYLGRGAFGVVYEVRDMLDHARYALKKVFCRIRGGSAVPKLLTRARTEVTKLARLTCDTRYIVEYKRAWVEIHEGSLDSHLREGNGSDYTSSTTPLSDFSSRTQSISDYDDLEEEESFYVLYIQMELCNVSLDVYVRRRNELYFENLEKNTHRENTAFDFKLAYNISLQLVSALCYLHEEVHMVHRDLKPANIIFAHDWSFKLGDFGLSIFLDDVVEEGIDYRVVYGTVLKYPKTTDGILHEYADDIYSLGLNLLRIFHPLKNDNDLIASVRRNVFSSEFHFAEDVEVKFPELRELFLSCTHSEYRKRPKVGQVLKVLKSYGEENSLIDNLYGCRDFLQQPEDEH